MSAEELPLIDPATTAAAEDDARSQDMPQGLTLASVSRDGRRMLFVDAAGREFTVEVDDRLRAALPADSPRRTEPAVTNPLRPREIQTRIRAGESAEDVAAAAGTTVDKIMAFAGPVLAEREHMAERAQKASVRRKAGEPAGAVRTLGEAVAVHLRTLDLTPDEITWDSYRRTDGRWKVIGDFATPVRSGTAELTFDTAGNYVALDNDDARWLVGDEVKVAAAEPVQDDLLAARQRRAATPPPAAEPEPAAQDTLDVEMPLEAFLEPDPEPRADEAKASEPEPVPEPVVEKPKPARRKGRASVPSWDEIMFGGKSD